MDNQTIGQLLGIGIFTLLSLLGLNAATSARKKPKGSGSNVIIDTATKIAGALSQSETAPDDAMSEKREDALQAMLTITDVLKETRATLVSVRVERDDLRRELMASRQSREEDAHKRDELSSQVTLLRADVTRLQSEANEREESHKVELARARAEIADLTETNERQRDTIAMLQDYVSKLLPLLRKAGIDTSELPKLPPPMAETAKVTTAAELPKASGE